MEEEPIYWKMRDGSSISIDDMDINHLRNTLKMIIKNSTKPKKRADYKFEMNGEMAQEDEELYPQVEADGGHTCDLYEGGDYYAWLSCCECQEEREFFKPINK